MFCIDIPLEEQKRIVVDDKGD